MALYLYMAVLVVAGGLLSLSFSHVPGKPLRPVTGLPVLILGTVGVFLFGVWIYTGLPGFNRTVELLFPDRLSKLAGGGIYLLIALALGLARGLIRAGSPGAYLRKAAYSPLHRILTLSCGLGFGGLVLLCALLTGDPTPTPLRFSELCCGNFTLAQAETGEWPDYLELVNTGDETLELEGCFLSDRPKKRNLFRLPARTLEPGEVLLLWADGAGKSGGPQAGDIHLNFSIAPGETVYLTSPQGVLLEQVQVPERYKNVSLSRLEGEWTLAAGTPGQPNGGGAAYTPATLEAPVFSRPGGFYPQPVELTVTAAPGCTVHYTLDSSLPDETDPVWEGALTLTDVSGAPNRVVSQPNTTLDRSGAVTDPVDKATVVRAIAVDDTGARSPVVTQVYFVGDFSAYRGRLLLSVTADPRDLFGNYGICVTGLDYDWWLSSGGQGTAPYPFFLRRGRLLERDGVLQVFDEAGQPILSQACGLRVQGDSSRNRALKRFAFYARKIYSGSSAFESPLPGSFACHSLSVRTDELDVILHLLMEGRRVGGLAGVPATLFLNGEYYYDCNLRERYDAQYFASHYGLEEDNLVLLSEGELDVGRQEDLEDYLDFLAQVQTRDCADPQVWAWVRSRMDVESYAEYVACNLYCNNGDWSEGKDYKLWRAREPRDGQLLDGRWRWLIYDMDACYWSHKDLFGEAPRASYNPFSLTAPQTGRSFRELPLFSALMKSPEFREIFARTWMDLMNGPLSPEAALPVMEAWGLPEDSFLRDFLAQRPAYALELLKQELGLQGQACGLTLSVTEPEGGAVTVNTVTPDTSGGSWTGTYLTDYPVTLTAQAAPGWRFVGWTGAVEASEATVSLALTGDAAAVTAVFEKN